MEVLQNEDGTITIKSEKSVEITELTVRGGESSALLITISLEDDRKVV